MKLVAFVGCFMLSLAAMIQPREPGWTVNGSHWTGVKAVAEEMGRRGHKVTVAIPEVSVLLGPGKHY